MLSLFGMKGWGWDWVPSKPPSLGPGPGLTGGDDARGVGAGQGF